MRISSRNIRFAYLSHGVLSFLVLAALGWATLVQLRLERAEHDAAVERERTARLREAGDNFGLALFKMEAWANPLLYAEFSRSYREFSPFYLLDTDEVRVRSGEMLPRGFIVQPSPLFMQPPRQHWIRLYFHASQRNGFQSPQLPPPQIRSWPEYASTYETWDRSPYVDQLHHLADNISVGDLISLYDKARHGARQPTDIGAPTLANGDPAEERAAITAQRRGDAKGMRLTAYYASRKDTADSVQQAAQQEQAQCAPEQLVVRNAFAERQFAPIEPSNERGVDEEDIGIESMEWQAIWLPVAGRSEPYLAFVRKVFVGGDTVLHGFLIDWQEFSAELVTHAQPLLPDAKLQRLDTPASQPPDEVAFSLIPARLVVKEPVIANAPFKRNATHTYLVLGWVGTLFVLVALGLGIHSLISVSERRAQFAYSVTHELRTPLTTFRLYTDMLSQGLVSEENKQSYLDTLNGEAKRLTDVVSGVLEYSRIENDSVSVIRDDTSIGEILDTVRETFQPRCANAGMKLEIDHDAAGKITVRTDKQLAVQIIGNLIDNACKYGRNDADPTISVTAVPENGHVCIEVADHGPGIAPQHRSRIFRPYCRAETDPGSVTGGLGLGLALSRNWARLLGGKLELVPTPKGEAGARFRFEFGDTVT